MSTSALLVCAVPRGYGAARMPWALAKAGFTVTLLAPPNSLAEKSGFVSRVGRVPDGATTRQWLYAFAAAVRASAPRLVVPGDDIALRLLQSIVLAPPPDLRPDLRQELATLVGDSLGDPLGYPPGSDQVALPEAAAALGVRVAPFVVTARPDEADAFAASVGYPVLAKRRHPAPGQAFATCADRSALARALEELARPSAFDLDERGDGRVLVQAPVGGTRWHYCAAAWRGSVVAGWAALPLVEAPGTPPSTTVFRYRSAPQLRALAETLVRGFGMSGIVGLDCIVDASGAPVLDALVHHVTPLSHRGRGFDVDLCAALHAALHDTPAASRPDLAPDEEGVGVAFPEEWLRDPESAWLTDYPVDVPWEEPELIEAMLALRHELWPKERLAAAA
jgi:hypothetical protein